jgi:hypothetical protein
MKAGRFQSLRLSTAPISTSPNIFAFMYTMLSACDFDIGAKVASLSVTSTAASKNSVSRVKAVHPRAIITPGIR